MTREGGGRGSYPTFSFNKETMDVLRLKGEEEELSASRIFRKSSSKGGIFSPSPSTTLGGGGAPGP